MKSIEFLNEDITRVPGGWKHSGLGHKWNYETDSYPVYPLPRYSTFDRYSRHRPGTGDDIYHYMRFTQEHYATAGIDDLSGDEIADTLCAMNHTDKNVELAKVNQAGKTNFPNWSAFYDRLKQVYHNKMMDDLTR